MRRMALVAAWALAAGGCALESQERVSDYTQDGLSLYKKGDYAHSRETFQATYWRLIQTTAERSGM